MLKPTTVLVCESDTESIWKDDEKLNDIYEVQKTVRYGKIVVTVLRLRQEG